MKQLIVNADDFGLARLVNQGIIEAHCDGIVTSTSLMANGGAFEDAVEKASAAPHLSVGVHLSLVQGKPLSPPSEIPTLVGGGGTFCLTGYEFVFRALTHRIKWSEVEIELRRQIVRVFRAGITPTHLDGHQHLHVLPEVSRIVIRLAQEFAIPCVRCPIEEPSPVPFPKRAGIARLKVLKQGVTRRGVSWFARRLGLKLTRAGLHYPSHFFGMSQTGFLNAELLEAVLRNLPEGISELMCHPGYADSQLAETGTRLLSQRHAEMRALTLLRTSGLLVQEGIQLVNYAALSGASSSGSTPERVNSGYANAV